MTETCTADGPNRFAELALPIILLSARMFVYQVFGILNFGHWNLFGICELRFVILVLQDKGYPV
jgi:hypothetical protein